MHIFKCRDLARKILKLAEACPAVGHMSLMNKIKGVYAPDKKRKIYIFLPLMKKLSWGTNGADSKTIFSFVNSYDILPPKGRTKFRGWQIHSIYFLKCTSWSNTKNNKCNSRFSYSKQGFWSINLKFTDPDPLSTYSLAKLAMKFKWVCSIWRA